MSYGKISILLNYLPSADTPPIRLWRTSPASGGRINRSMLSCRNMASLLSIHSAPSKRGKGGGASHQRGKAFPRPQGSCMVFPRAKARLYGFRRQRRHKKWRPWGRRTFPAERYFIPPEGGALNPSGRRQPVPDRTLGAQGQRPGGAINPRPRKRASTFGNTGKHRPGPSPDPTRATGA